MGKFLEKNMTRLWSFVQKMEIRPRVLKFHKKISKIHIYPSKLAIEMTVIFREEAS
jgi:hypothetical protein